MVLAAETSAPAPRDGTTGGCSRSGDSAAPATGALCLRPDPCGSVRFNSIMVQTGRERDQVQLERRARGPRMPNDRGLRIFEFQGGGQHRACLLHPSTTVLAGRFRYLSNGCRPANGRRVDSIWKLRPGSPSCGLSGTCGPFGLERADGRPRACRRRPRSFTAVRPICPGKENSGALTVNAGQPCFETATQGFCRLGDFRLDRLRAAVGKATGTTVVHRGEFLRD